MMYPNLDYEINCNKMSWRSVARAVGMPENTFNYKIKCGSFAVEEAFAIQKTLFPKYEAEYLFEKTSDFSQPTKDEVSK